MLSAIRNIAMAYWPLALIPAVGFVGWAGYRALRSDPTNATEAAAQKKAAEEKASAGGGSVGSLSAVARQAANDTLWRRGCQLDWKTFTSEAILYTYGNKLFLPLAKASPSSSVDELAAEAMTLMVPTCTWPPKKLEGFNVQAGVDGSLSAVEQLAFDVVSEDPTVKVYLAIRRAAANARARA
jgi:hypothetical protein